MKCGLKLLTKPQKRSHFFKHDTSEIQKADPKTLAEVHKTYREAGVLNCNEIRADLGKNPIEGGDEYWKPNANHIEGESGRNGDDLADSADDIPSDSANMDANARAIEDRLRSLVQSSLDEWRKNTYNTIERHRAKKTQSRFNKWLAEFKPEFPMKDEAERLGIECGL